MKLNLCYALKTHRCLPSGRGRREIKVKKYLKAQQNHALPVGIESPTFMEINVITLDIYLLTDKLVVQGVEPRVEHFTGNSFSI
jgi:hypothetical protein